MRTKTYELTEMEVLALKMSTMEYYHQTKHIDSKSPIITAMYKALESLKDQFANDYSAWFKD